MARVRKPPFRRPSPRWFHDDFEAPPRLPPGCLQRRNEAVVLDEEGRVEPTTGENSRVMLLRSVLCKFIS